MVESSFMDTNLVFTRKTSSHFLFLLGQFNLQPNKCYIAWTEINMNPSQKQLLLSRKRFFSIEKYLAKTPLKCYGLFLLLIWPEISNPISSGFWHKELLGSYIFWMCLGNTTVGFINSFMITDREESGKKKILTLDNEKCFRIIYHYEGGKMVIRCF